MPMLSSFRNQSIDLLLKSLSGFYMRATLAFNGLSKKVKQLLQRRGGGTGVAMKL